VVGGKGTEKLWQGAKKKRGLSLPTGHLGSGWGEEEVKKKKKKPGNKLPLHLGETGYLLGRHKKGSGKIKEMGKEKKGKKASSNAAERASTIQKN